MLKILALPFLILKALFTLLKALLSVLESSAKVAEHVAGELEKESARWADEARLSREASIQELQKKRQIRRLAMGLERKPIDPNIEKQAHTAQPNILDVEDAFSSTHSDLPSTSSQRLPTIDTRITVDADKSNTAILDAPLGAPSKAPDTATPIPAQTKDIQGINACHDSTPGPIALLLFDLDGTLLDTSDLEQWRGCKNVGPQNASYAESLAEAYRRSPVRHFYHLKHLRELKAHFSELQIGVFTRSPRAYAQVLLDLAFPEFKWDILVAFEDVTRTKPHGEGVSVAMRTIGMNNVRRVALVGDDIADIQAAYESGCIALLETRSLPRPNWRALEKIPDGILRGPASLTMIIETPTICLPALEQVLSMAPMQIQKLAPRSLRFDSIPHFGDNGERVDVFVMGRLFTENQEFSKRIQWHELTRSILDHKNASAFPAAWTLVLGAFLRNCLIRHQQIVVTVIPAKEGRTPRMESLLEQLMRDVPAEVAERCMFIPDLLRYAHGAESHSRAHLTRAQRMASARAHLSVARRPVALGHDIVVIDDVVTSGATLIHAYRQLVECGARSVTCTALAKAVRAQ